MGVEMLIKQEFIKRKYSTAMVRLYKLEKPGFEGISSRNRFSIAYSGIIHHTWY
jgi:hypothetical protein